MKCTNKNAVRHSLAVVIPFLCFSCINSIQPLEESSETPHSPTYKAVSYTHLDVYKRQN